MITADKIALQLYTVRSLTAEDMPGTLRKVAELGYRAVELAGFGNSNPEEVRRSLDDLGMRAIGIHLGLSLWQDPRAALEIARTLGCGDAVLPGVPTEYRQSAKRVRELAQSLNDWGAASRDAGIRFSYHNHDWEFAALGDGSAWDMLTSGTDPKLVNLELDAYWAQFAGKDPVELIGQLAGRLPLLHVKDMANEPSRRDAPVGAGVINWGAILNAAARAGTEWYIVEQDHPQDALKDVEASLRQLEEWAKGPSIGTAPHSQPL